MKLLVDTCVFLWMIDEVECLSASARTALEDASNEVILHQASCWEIQIKYDLGKLPMAQPPGELIPAGLRDHNIQYHRLQDEEIWHLRKLPTLHRDPFDRILMASALCQGLRMISPDPWIARYPVPILW